MQINSFAIIGGDERQAYLANILSDEGYPVITCGLDKYPGLYPGLENADLNHTVTESDVVILPLPASLDDVFINSRYSFNRIYLAGVFAAAKKEQYIFGGKLNKKLAETVRDRGIKIYDYLEREELSILNAIPTVEGAIEIAIRETNITLFGADCLVAGFGRIGKILARTLRDMGAHVTVSVRKSADMAWVKAERMNVIHTDRIRKHAGQFDVIFNTVPYLLFGEATIAAMKNDVLVIDLASAPGGIDCDAAQNAGIKTIQALSLPGKVAPKAAAKIIRDTIFNILQEENI